MSQINRGEIAKKSKMTHSVIDKMTNWRQQQWSYFISRIETLQVWTCLKSTMMKWAKNSKMTHSVIDKITNWWWQQWSYFIFRIEILQVWTCPKSTMMKYANNSKMTHSEIDKMTNWQIDDDNIIAIPRTARAELAVKNSIFMSNLNVECFQLSFDIHIVHIGQKRRIFKNCSTES